MKRIILLTALSCLYFFNAQAQVTRYVKPVASGTGDGSSWVNASSDLQLMINNSASGDFLFVAAGTYQASFGASYVMKEGVKIYGGFAGTETLLSQRNWTTNVTILRGDNAPVVRNFFNGLTVAAVLDGFTFTNGNGGSSAGGGILNQSVNPTISNCIITGNIAYWGGGMANTSCSPTINNCTFSGNTGTEGGGMYNNPSMPDIHNCTFISNSAPRGGAMYNYNINSGGTIANCSFTNNVAANGGAIYSFNSAYTIQQSTFSENHANYYNTASSGNGGVFYNEQNSNVSITGSTFINNTSYRAGAVMINLFSNTSISDSHFAGNSGADGGALVFSNSSTATISRSTFLQNTATHAGGALVLSGDAAFNNCIFSGNNSPAGGAGNSSGGNTTFTNCLLTGNASTMGSAFYSYAATTTFNNSTIAGNNGPSGSVLSEAGSTTNINNSIVWGNSTAIANNSSTTNVQYSIVQGGYAGTGNQNTDPQFLSLPSYTTAPFTNGDFHPFICSPAVNAGSNALVAAGNTSDPGFLPRILGPAVDLGAYEYGVIPSASNIIYVNSSVIGGANSGSSWNDAKRSLAEVLRYVKAYENLWTPANPLKIFVAKGRHTPLFRPDNPCSSVNPDDRNNTFLMVNNVTLYGGFDPVNGIDDLSDSRILGISGSVLSGDIGLPINLTDNSYHVVVFSGTGTSAGLDGFTITAGNANGIGTTQANGNIIERNNGGGVYLYNSSPSFPNCTFQFNSSSNYAGAVYAATNANFTASYCTFSNNSAVFGGSIFTNNLSIAAVNNSMFANNTAGYGGAIFDHTGGSTSLTECTFVSNSCSGFGGATYINGNITPAYNNCTFSGNTSSSDGGAIFNNQGAPIMTNCSFANNNASQNGGAIYNYSAGAPLFNHCSFSTNSSGVFGGAIYSEPAATTNFIRCDFTSNSSQFGGALLNGSNLNMQSCSFSDNQAASYGGAVYNTGSQQVFSNCVFTGNRTINGGGGGGAIFNNYISGSTSIINNIFYNNTSTFGGAVHNWSSATATIRNSVIWNNSSAVYNESAASATVQNTLIQGGYAGVGNISADPLFTNPSQPKGGDGIWGTNDDGLHVQPCSPAINVGVNGSIFPGITEDLSGQPRIQYTTVDMGAYEANSLANTSASNIVSVNTTVNGWQVANAATYYASNCTSLVAAVTGNGTATAISGNTTAKVWIETTQPLQFVKRHYEITPQANAGTATAIITLYFTQAEFDAFNAINTIKLPQSPPDATGKSNLLIEKRSGTSNDGTGNPFSYTGTVATINPTDADITWNATASRWEVSFAVTGFSGFFVKTQLFTLPLRLVSFTAEERSCISNLQWTTKNESNVSHFDVQQSNDGILFNTIKTITAKNTGNENNYAVNVPVTNNKMFYRLKMVDIDDKATYSHVDIITAVCDNKIVISPNPVKDKLYIRNASVGSQYAVYDNDGRRIRNGQIGNAIQEVSVTGIASGIYNINITGKDGSNRRVSFVKE